MATLAIVPVEEYLRTSYEPDMEYVNGQLVERHVGEYFHSRMQWLIASVLSAREQERGFTGFTEQRVQVSDQPRYRIPDLCVMAEPHEVTPILLNPDLVIEIVSPDDSFSDMLTKIDEYLAAGIAHIWVIDPYKQTVSEADREGIRRCVSGIVETDLVGQVDFNSLFARLGKPRS